MVVILLLPPYSTNGCDGRSSNESSSPATSTTSTGDTAIPTASYAGRLAKSELEDHNNNRTPNGSHYTTLSPLQTTSAPSTTQPPSFDPSSAYEYNNNAADEGSNTSHYHCYQSPASISPPPPPLPTSKPPSYVPPCGWHQYHQQQLHHQQPDITTTTVKLGANIVPKPPRCRAQQTLETIPEHVPQLPEPSMAPEPTRSSASIHSRHQRPPSVPHTTPNPPTTATFNNSNYFTNTTTNYVRHVTRVNFYDIDTSQVEYESRDYDGEDADNKDDCDLDDNMDDCTTEAVTKEEEWITKRKTELTTTRQIETHVKRQVVFEDGKVIEDSGPIVSTNTTEDTDKQETETTEKRDLGLPVGNIDAVDGKSKGALPLAPGGSGELAEVASGSGGTLVKSMVPKPADGLVREINDKRVVSHEETKNYMETEDIKHRGDFSDEAFVKAVTSGVENVEETLLSAAEYQKQLVAIGPRLVANTTKSFKTIDSEDVQKRSLAQEDGKIITEQKKTTEHEVIVDDELPDDYKSVGSQERVKTIEANQRYFKQRDEQHVDLVKDGKVVGTEMKYAAETMQLENDDILERPDDWDSLSDRMRKMRKPYNKSVMQHPKGGILMDRKDALTKRPLDFDREEETRKGETIKWLESHFGSESTASNDSREDEGDVIEPTKKTYFNVTIKSNQNQATATNPPYEATDKKAFVKRSVDVMNGVGGGGGGGVGGGAANNGAKYYQGISNWSNRKDTPATTPANHFASKAFRDDLHASIERNQLRKSSAVYTSKDNLSADKPPYVKSPPTDSYVSREDILQQKRQSLSSQFLARSRQNSRDHLDDVDKVAQTSFDEDRYISGSRTDLHYGLNLKEKEKRSYTRAEIIDEPDSPAPPRKNSYIEERAKSYERTFVENNRYNSLRSDNTPTQREVNTLERPAVPQRRRNGEKKLRQQHDATPDHKSPIEIAEPPPDYSPPPRSRSSSPREDYHNVRTKSYAHPQPLYSTSSVPEQQSSREVNTFNRKQNQRTRFARNTPSPPTAAIQHQHHPHPHPHPHPHQHQQHNQTLRPSMLTQTTQTTPSTISTSTVASHRSSKVGQVIGNSLRKLVGKLRSASVERKLRMKSKSKSREHSPAPAVVHHHEQQNQRNVTTYQQYNVIDGHIGGNPNTTSHDDSEEELAAHQRIPYQASKTGESVYSNASVDRRVLLHTSSSHPVGANNRDGYRVISPKQRYYLGEDPYSSTLYGKENVQEIPKLQRNGGTASYYSNNTNNSSRENTSSHTLGRYQKGNQRISGSTPNLNQGYRSTQTLPRKLNEHPPVHQYETQTMNISRSNVTAKVQSKLRQQQQHLQQQQQHQHQQQSEQRIAYQPIAQNTGPLKPARTYAKSLNRSKSFSVHAMNGSNDPSPIYMEKLTNNNYTNNLQSSHAFKSNPHLYSSSKESSLQQTPLKSPSIVNLISRSQRDLSKIGTNEDESDTYAERQAYTNNRKYYDDRKAIPPYRSAGPHADDDYKYRSPGHYHLQSKHSLDSRGSVDINKDTASIVRQEEYQRTKRTPPSGSTIIKVRNMDYRK